MDAAEASDSRASSFAVYTSDNDLPISIWGMIDQGVRPHEVNQNGSHSGQDSPGIFQASTLGVGHLGISIGTKLIAELRVDQIFGGTGLDPLNAGPICDALGLGREEHVSAIRQAMSPEMFDERNHWAEAARSQWTTTVARMLLRIRGMQRGGAVLMTPDTSVTGLEVKYDISYPRLPHAAPAISHGSHRRGACE